MVNTFTNEFTLSIKKEPPHTPFVVPELRKEPKNPMVSPLVSYGRARKSWRDSVPKMIKDLLRQVRTQSRRLYALRYLVTGDLTDSWVVGILRWAIRETESP